VSHLPRIDDDLIADYLGEETLERGYLYFDSGHVLESTWSESANVLTGRVSGTRSTPYAVSVIFSPSPRPDGRPALLATSCTCPMRSACKHVAAVLFNLAVAVEEYEVVTDEYSAAPPAWLAQLAPVARAAPSDAPARARRILGLQVRVTPPRPPTRYGQEPQVPGLQARLVVMGSRERWVQGGLSWTTVTYAYDAGTSQQRSAVRQLAALYALDHPYAGRESWMNLERIKAPLLWQVLEQIVEADVPITLDDRAQTPVTLVRERVEAGIDISRHDGGLAVAVPIVIDGRAASPGAFGFLGSPATAVFAWDTDPDATTANGIGLRLARLAEPLPDALVELAVQPPVRVPDADVDTFAQGVLPALRAQHPVTSHDGSFVMPDLPRPVLDLHLQHLGQARLEVSWGWRYAVPGADPSRAPRVPLWAGRAGDPVVRRDEPAEGEILAGLDWLIADYPHLGAPTASGHRLASIGVLAGLPMLAFARDALPVLEQDQRILVTVSGTPIDYREATEAPAITVTATPRESTRDWLDLSVTVAVDGQDVPFDELLRALATEQELLILASGTYLRLDQPELQQLRRLVEEARSLQEHVRDELGVSRYHVDLWAELEQLGVVDTQAAAWRQALTSLSAGGSIPPRALSPRVDATLRGYQSDGYAWLAYLRDNGLGGVLADDMGLGKTLQAIALIADARDSQAEAGPPPPWLVVAPASVVHNWAAEVERFAPSLSVVAIGETSAKRGTGLADTTRRADVVVVSYTLFRLDFDEFDALEWSGLVLDEAQFVKNHQSKAYACARRLDVPTKLAITGTPMENNLMELWSLLSITAPGLFPSPKRFAEYYQRPIEREADSERLALLRRRIRPFMLRRTKEEVADDLPPKQEQVLELDLHPRHRKLYDTHLQRERQKVLGLLGDLDSNRFQIFQSLTMLRQLSLDASLIDDKHAGIPSAKLDALMEMLDDVVAEGHRVLVFSQFTRYLALARARLDAAGIRHAYLDGRTRNRGKVIDGFRDGSAPVFLISLKAGGFGLNLTEADYVVLLDPWWNPATEAQAVDRAHRIGQAKQVMVYRLVSRGTIEEKVMALKAEKAALFAGVMGDAGAGGAGLSVDDIRELLG
jgi:superfamily II DNA or RNA helicase